MPTNTAEAATAERLPVLPPAYAALGDDNGRVVYRHALIAAPTLSRRFDGRTLLVPSLESREGDPLVFDSFTFYSTVICGDLRNVRFHKCHFDGTVFEGNCRVDQRLWFDNCGGVQYISFESLEVKAAANISGSMLAREYSTVVGSGGQSNLFGTTPPSNTHVFVPTGTSRVGVTSGYHVNVRGAAPTSSDLPKPSHVYLEDGKLAITVPVSGGYLIFYSIVAVEPGERKIYVAVNDMGYVFATSGDGGNWPHMEKFLSLNSSGAITPSQDRNASQVIQDLLTLTSSDFCSNCRARPTICRCPRPCGTCGSRNCHGDCDSYWRELKHGLEFRASKLERRAHKGRVLLPAEGPVRFVGCEIEISSASKKVMVEKTAKAIRANIVHDGSLPDGGIEIVTQPALGQTAIADMELLCDSLKNAHARVNESCGLHVHVDAREFGMWEIRRLIRIYSKVEEALYSLVSKSRWDSHYGGKCKEKYAAVAAATSTVEIKRSLWNSLYKIAPTSKEDVEDIKAIKQNKYHDSRYRGLNLHSWAYRGTVEFRMHHGSTKANKIMGWATVCSWIVHRAASKSDAWVDSLPEDPMTALMAVCNGRKIRTWITKRAHELERKGK